MSAMVFDRPTRPSPHWARLDSRVAPPTAVRASTMPARRRRTPPAVYRRRRVLALLSLVTVAFLAGVVLAISLLPSPAGGSLTDEARTAQQVRYVVQPGDTLWSAAGHLAPADDPRNVVDVLSSARGTSELRVGDVLVWPPD